MYVYAYGIQIRQKPDIMIWGKYDFQKWDGEKI